MEARSFYILILILFVIVSYTMHKKAILGIIMGSLFILFFYANEHHLNKPFLDRHTDDNIETIIKNIEFLITYTGNDEAQISKSKVSLDYLRRCKYSLNKFSRLYTYIKTNQKPCAKIASVKTDIYNWDPPKGSLIGDPVIQFLNNYKITDEYYPIAIRSSNIIRLKKYKTYCVNNLNQIIMMYNIDIKKRVQLKNLKNDFKKRINQYILDIIYTCIQKQYQNDYRLYNNTTINRLSNPNFVDNVSEYILT